MKKILFISVLVIILSVGQAFAQMGGGHMMGGQGSMMEQTERSETSQQQHPCQTGGGMMYGGGMGHGMMSGYGCGMMGHGGHMMGRGMMHGCGMGQGMHSGCGMMGHGGHMMGPGHGGHMYGWKGDYDQKFLDETKDLRKDLHNRKFEYFEAARNPETDTETITKLEKEIREIQEKLYEKAPRKAYRSGGSYGHCW